MVYLLANRFPASTLTYRYNYDPSGGAVVDVDIVDTGEITSAKERAVPLFIAPPGIYTVHVRMDREHLL